MVTILVVGFIAWALAGAVEDNIRAVRGDAPRETRPGFRGYLDNRFRALADRHQRTAESGRVTALGRWEHKRSLAREKALAVAGYKTREEIARAAAEHRRRLDLIDRGVDPDTGERLYEEPEVEPVAPADDAPEIPSVEDHFDSNRDVWEDPDLAPPIEPDPHPYTDDHPPEPGPEDQPWSPYADNTEQKENTMTGEINGPNDVKEFHDALAEVFDNINTLTDTLMARAIELGSTAHDLNTNLTATENAAAGMRALGMYEAAQAAGSLLEIQGQAHAALAALAAAHQDAAGALADQASGAQAYLSAILKAYEAQIRMQDERAGVGLGNLAADRFLDGND